MNITTKVRLSDIVHVISAAILIMMLCIPAVMAAQSGNKIPVCSVEVLDEENQPLAGALVKVTGTDMAQLTDADGKCSFTSVPSASNLEISFMGYKKLTIPVAGKRNITAHMEIESILADEVVVVGYGTMRKRDLSGSVAQIKGETLQEVSALSPVSALQGRISGVQVTQNSGQPGATLQVRIRGANSVKGSNEPLWIINGYPGDIDMINTADIESIEILKDASATAIYGSRGANGVVIVTTKGAKEGDFKVEYRGNVGFQEPVKTMEMMDGYEYMEYLNTKAAINNQPQVYGKIDGPVYMTDWQKAIFRKSLVTEHSININGGTKKFQSAFGLSFFDQNGIIKNSGFRRLNVSADLKYNFSKYISAKATIMYSRADQDLLDASTVIYRALSASPLAPVRDSEGYWNDFTDQPISAGNALANIEETTNKWTSHRILVNGGIIIKPVDGLSIDISASYRNKDSRNDVYIPTTYSKDYDGSASISFANSTQFTSNNIVTFEKEFGKHRLNVMGGVTYEYLESKSTSTGTATGFISDAQLTYDLDAATVKGTPTSSYYDWDILSFLGRINYNYDNRYLLTINFRADGSSRFNRGNKWGYFPSAAGAWRISQEHFMEDVDWISDLKIRGGYGITGSTSIDPYATMSLLSSENVVFDDKTVPAYRPQVTFTKDLKWERTAQTDIGIDLDLFNNRVRLTTDLYYKKTTDLLNTVEMQPSSGYTTATRNIGSLVNKGFEIQVDARILDGTFKWDMGANFSMNRSKVKSLSNHHDIFGSTVSTPSGLVSGQLNLLREGCPMYVFYGYVEDGYDDTGMIAYKDLDDDGKITTKDRTIIGNPNPDFTFGFNTVLRYKRLSLSAFFQGSVGNDIYGMSMSTFAYRYNYNANALRDVLYNHWTPEHPNAKYPNLYQDINLRLSDRFVYDGSYLRMKNIELAYDIPCGKGKVVKSARISVSAQNLFTLTSYPFWDPDVNSRGGGSSLVQGVDAASYPSARSYLLGCKLSF